MSKATLNRATNIFISQLDLILQMNLIKYPIWDIALYVAETDTLENIAELILEVLNCSSGGEWWKTVETIVWKMKNYYNESKRKGTFYLKETNEG